MCTTILPSLACRWHTAPAFNLSGEPAWLQSHGGSPLALAQAAPPQLGTPGLPVARRPRSPVGNFSLNPPTQWRPRRRGPARRRGLSLGPSSTLDSDAESTVWGPPGDAQQPCRPGRLRVGPKRRDRTRERTRPRGWLRLLQVKSAPSSPARGPGLPRFSKVWTCLLGPVFDPL